MSRAHRSHLPGAAFHITARTQGHAHLFVDEIRDTVQAILIEGIRNSDAQRLALSIMPNHFHLVIRQGSKPLGWLLQPVMRRIAMLVQRTHRLQGHVFERRFRSHLCDSPDYLRNAIVYTHINPLRANLCTNLAQYRWTSHAELIAREARTCEEHPNPLYLFCDRAPATQADLVASYMKYVEWRITADQFAAEEKPYTVAPPPSAYGDAHFVKMYGALPTASPALLSDLRDVAIQTLLVINRDIDVNELRTSRCSRPLTRIRRQLIASLLQRGYRGRAISRFFGISDAVVSKIAIQMRYQIVPNP
jgi:putative transposase